MAAIQATLDEHSSSLGNIIRAIAEIREQQVQMELMLKRLVGAPAHVERHCPTNNRQSTGAESKRKNSVVGGANTWQADPVLRNRSSRRLLDREPEVDDPDNADNPSSSDEEELKLLEDVMHQRMAALRRKPKGPAEYGSGDSFPQNRGSSDGGLDGQGSGAESPSPRALSLSRASRKVHKANEALLDFSVRTTLRLVDRALPVVFPHSTAVRMWNGLMRLLAAYTALAVPLQFSFARGDGWSALNVIVDVCFILEVLLKFRTAYRDMGMLVLDTYQISMNYIRGELLYDFISAVPYASIVLALSADAHWEKLAFNVMLISRFLFCFVRISQAADNLENSVRFNPALKRLLLALVMLLLCCHWTGCIWWYASEKSPSWAAADAGSQGWAPSAQILAHDDFTQVANGRRGGR